VPYAGGIAQFLTDANYSQQCFVTAEPLLAKKKNKPAASFFIAEGTLVIARRQYVERNRKQTRDFLEASRDGWGEYLRAPESANAWMVKLNPAMDGETMKESAAVQMPFILAANTPNKELGKMSSERWATLVDQLLKLKLIKTKPAVEKLFQNF
jgi:NitT/TauT family transport system substrate-binding protein